VGNQGVVLSSTNGQDWTLRDGFGLNPLRAVAFGSDTCVATGLSTLIWGTSGAQNWSGYVNDEFDDLYGVCFANGQFVAVGSGGQIQISTDGMNWENRRQGFASKTNTEPDYQCAAYGRGTFVVQGWASAVSTNNANWMTSGSSSPAMNTLAYGNAVFVGVSDGHEGGSQPVGVHAVETSSDGFNWTIAPSPTGAGLSGVAFGNGQFMVVGIPSSPSNWVVSASADGLTWTNRLAGSYQLTSVTYGDGMFVAVGRNSIVLTSTDGISWMNRTVPLPVDFGRIAYGNGCFVAVNGGSAKGVVIISTNAVDWTMHGTGALYPFADITFAAGLFVGVSGSSVYSSTNGVQWTRHETQALYGLTTVTYGAETFVVAGSQGAILQSDVYLPPIVVSGRWLGSQGFEISFDGEVGRHYRIQSSADLAAWTDLFSLTTSEPHVQFTDSAATGLARRFYRVVSP
jgi:hypothetical protein